jgi:hypothetical protein
MKLLYTLILIFFLSQTGFSQSHIIRAHIDTLLTYLPAISDTLIKDKPMFETPNVHPQNTFELTQLYYDKSTPIRVIQFKMQDYSINPDYYHEQAMEAFNLDNSTEVNRSEKLSGYDTHIYISKYKTSVTMFLGDYMIAEIKQEGTSWTVNQLRDFVSKFPITKIRNRMLEIGKLYRKTKKSSDE